MLLSLFYKMNTRKDLAKLTSILIVFRPRVVTCPAGVVTTLLDGAILHLEGRWPLAW